ncbi:MAG: hypothetical protein KAQ67_10510 [Gammaproteobacteria bacterium]|nr:hypothetical protein [Gammaproteobacteria bacterium]
MSEQVYRYLKFPINRWKHLYSLEQAILHASDDTGRQLVVEGSCSKLDFLAIQKLDFELTLVNVSQYPQYRKLHGGHMVLATLTYDSGSQTLKGEMMVDSQVFEELRSNIIEYSAIDGIFIEAELGLRFADKDTLENGEKVDMISFQYAMRS